VSYPSSEEEFHPRVARPIVWWALGPWVCLVRVFRFVCVYLFTFYEFKQVSLVV
jgi:hypothetical protein